MKHSSIFQKISLSGLVLALASSALNAIQLNSTQNKKLVGSEHVNPPFTYNVTVINNTGQPYHFQLDYNQDGWGACDLGEQKPSFSPPAGTSLAKGTTTIIPVDIGPNCQASAHLNTIEFFVCADIDDCINYTLPAHPGKNGQYGHGDGDKMYAAFINPHHTYQLDFNNAGSYYFVTPIGGTLK